MICKKLKPNITKNDFIIIQSVNTIQSTMSTTPERHAPTIRRSPPVMLRRRPQPSSRDFDHHTPIRQLDFDSDQKKTERINLSPSFHLHNCASNSECSICFENDVNASNGGSLHCNHTFHNECIRKWFEFSASSCSTCPNCREVIDVRSFS